MCLIEVACIRLVINVSLMSCIIEYPVREEGRIFRKQKTMQLKFLISDTRRESKF